MSKYITVTPKNKKDKKAAKVIEEMLDFQIHKKITEELLSLNSCDYKPLFPIPDFK